MSATTDFLLADDVDLVMDPETYPEQAGPAPVAPGNYALRIVTLKPRKTQAGAPVTRTSKLAPGFNFPVYVIEKVRLVEPVENERDVMLFQDISTAPFLRGNQAAGQLQDILRAYDVNAGFRTLQEGLDLWNQFISEGRTFRAWVDWSAYDSAYAKAAIEEAKQFAAGGVLDDKTKNDIYNRAKVRGYKKFPRTSNGGYSHVWTGPTGNTVEGRAIISRFISAGDEKVKLGPAREFVKS